MHLLERGEKDSAPWYAKTIRKVDAKLVRLSHCGMPRLARRPTSQSLFVRSLSSRSTFEFISRLINIVFDAASPIDAAHRLPGRCCAVHQLRQ